MIGPERLAKLRRQARNEAAMGADARPIEPPGVVPELLDEIERLRAALAFIAGKRDEQRRNPMAVVLCGIAAEALGELDRP